MKGAFSGTMDSLSTLDKQILVERHLISREHAAKSAGSGLVLNRDETLCLMINEEDHLRMQALRPGLQLRQAWAAIDAADSDLGEEAELRFQPRTGLSDRLPDQPRHGHPRQRHASPARAGAGEQINPIIQSVNKLGLAVRGLYGEGTEALGNVFQVSNQMTLGESESGDRRAAGKGPGADHRARGKRPGDACWRRSPRWSYNHIGRAYGILANAHSISSKETMNLLSLMRLGVDLGLFPGVDRSLVDELFILTQPAHLQKQHSEKLSAEERDLLRADMVRERLRHVSRPVARAAGPPGAGLDKPAEVTAF